MLSQTPVVGWDLCCDLRRKPPALLHLHCFPTLSGLWGHGWLQRTEPSCQASVLPMGSSVQAWALVLWQPRPCDVLQHLWI